MSVGLKSIFLGIALLLGFLSLADANSKSSVESYSKTYRNDKTSVLINYKKANAAGDVAPVVTVTPIYTAYNDGSPNAHPVHYLINIHSGQFVGQDFFADSEALGPPNPEYLEHSKYASHYYLAFLPYIIADAADPSLAQEYVVPNTSVVTHTDQTDGGKVYFQNDTQFLYTGNDKGIDVKQALVLSITKNNGIVNMGVDISQPVFADTSKQPDNAPAGFDISQYSIETSVSPTTPSIYANGLQQAPINVTLKKNNTIISPSDKTDGWLYQHIFFVSCVTSACLAYQPVSGEFNMQGYSSVSSHAGPYATVLGSLSQWKLTQGVGKKYYFSSTVQNSNQYIAPMICVNQDPGNTGRYQVTCTPISGDVITINTKTTIDKNFYPIPVDKATIGFPGGEDPFQIKPADNNTLISPLTFSVNSDAYSLLGYPLMIGIPQYFVQESQSPLVSNSANELMNSNEDFENSKTVTLHLVDQYGNYYFGRLFNKPNS